MLTAASLPIGWITPFLEPGSTAQINSMAAGFLEPKDRFVRDGEIERIWIEDETIHIRFKWLVHKSIPVRTPVLLECEEDLNFSHSLRLFTDGLAQDTGRFIFLPMEPIVHARLILIAGSYIDPTGRVPLKLSHLGFE